MKKLLFDGEADEKHSRTKERREKMDWECIVISMAPEDVDAFTDQMIGLGIDQFALTDPREISEFMQTSVYYDYVEDDLVHKQKATLTVYVEKNNSGSEKMQKLFSLLQETNRRGVEFSVEIENIQEEDWMNSWKKFYKPIPVGEKLIIKPSWEKLPEGNTRIPLEIDPSSSFGTGTHETTRLCLANLEKVVFPGAEVLDMGCGSGILAVGAMLLGAGRALCVDVEEDAMRVTRENMLRNGVEVACFETLQGNALEEGVVREQVCAQQYDVIAANIVANVILAMQPLFQKVLKKTGKLIASGIILDRLEEVKSAYEQAGMSVEHVSIEGEWAALTIGC